MATAELFFDILARDHASAVFNKVGRAADQLGRRTDKASKSHQAFGKVVRWTGGVLSAYGVGQFLKSSVQEYAAAETAQNKLANSYRRFPAMQNVALQAFKDLNTQLMLHTQFDDDDTAAMQANLARFDLTGKQVMKLTPLVADLAQVQGTDMVTAGANLGKAMLGNTRALKALGITYTATGKRAEDARNVIGLVSKKVGGEATKAAETTAVKLKMLDNQYGELKETVGAAVLPAFTKLVDVAGPGIAKLSGWVDKHSTEIGNAFEDIWHGAEKVGGAIKTMWDGFQSIPPDTKKLLVALAGGTWALGKVKGSAFGQGLGTIFRGVKTITAGNVTVLGKTVTGGGVGGGKPGGGLLATVALNPLTVAALITGIGLAINAKNHANNPRSPMPAPAPGGLPGVANPGSPLVSNRNRQADFKDTRGWSEAMRERAAAGRAAYDAEQRYIRAARDSATAQDKARASERRRAEALGQVGRGSVDAAQKTRAFGSSVDKLPKAKRVNVAESGADPSRGRVKGLHAAIAALRPKRVNVAESGADPSRTRVRNLGGSISGLKSKTVTVGADTSGAVSNLNGLLSKIAEVRNAGITIGGTVNVKKAMGGMIVGPGTGTSDSIPAMLSNGEYVVKASAVAKYGLGFLDAVNSGRLSRFAPGGKVSKATRKEIRQSQNEANRQQRIAKQANRRGLSDNVLSFLGGMSSQAALASLAQMNDKQLRRAARKANAVNALQTRRQKQRDKTAADNQAKLDKDAADIEAAKQAQADAAAAWQREADAQKAVRDAIEETAASYRAFASIATTSVTDVADAQSQLSDANAKVLSAQKAMDLAGSDRERAAAAQELTQALAAQRTAQQGLSNAGKPSTASIRGNMAGRLTKLRSFAGAVKQLKDLGLNAVTLADIVGMGPEQGYDFAKALLDGGFADINDLQSQITTEAANLGLTSAGINSAAATVVGQANAAAGGLNVSLVPAPVTLQLDGRTIATALLEYQRQSGGG